MTAYCESTLPTQHVNRAAGREFRRNIETGMGVDPMPVLFEWIVEASGKVGPSNTGIVLKHRYTYFCKASTNG